MAKVIRNINQCFWICLICGVSGALYDAFRQWQTGRMDALLGAWLVFASLSVVFWLVKNGMRNLDERLTRLEQSK
jgi:hypothetical protein